MKFSVKKVVGSVQLIHLSLASSLSPSLSPSLRLWDTCLSESSFVTLPPTLLLTDLTAQHKHSLTTSCCALQTKPPYQQHRQACVCVATWYDTGLNGANQDIRDSWSPRDKLPMLAHSTAWTLYAYTQPNRDIWGETQWMRFLVGILSKSWG